MKLSQLKDKEVLILGLGKEGFSTLRFLKKIFPKKKLAIADQKEKISEKLKNYKKIKLYLGKDYLKAIKNYEVIIKSPGIPPKIIKPYLKKNQILTSATQIFFENCSGKIIGVTGTKGKSTSCGLIYKVLKSAKKKVFLIGNIGKPFLNYLISNDPNSIYVFELSSFQLSNLKKSPHIAVLLNIYKEHLDYHQSFKEYIKSKANITLYQKEKDYLIYNYQNKIVREVAKKSKAKKIPIKNPSFHLEKIGLNKNSLFERHFSLSIAVAILVGKIFKISKENIKKAIENFKSFPHRMEKVGNFKGIIFFNDSLSTIPESTILALDTLGKKVKTLILGGYDRGVDFKKLAKRILESKIENLIFFPESGKRIWKEIDFFQKRKRRFFLEKNVFFVKKMSKAVKLAFSLTPKNHICLFSPASPSFGLFRDYRERGNLFKKYVKKYGQE